MTCYLALCLILIIGSTYSKMINFFGLMGLNFGSESLYSKNILQDVNAAVTKMLDRLLLDSRISTPDAQNVHIIIDAGWSHPGWWARECTVIGIDGATGLPLSVKHILKGKGYKGSSRSMEGAGVMEIMTELDQMKFKVTRLLHDKDASTLLQVMDVFEDVEECLCLNHGVKNFKKAIRRVMDRNSGAFKYMQNLDSRSAQAMRLFLLESKGDEHVFKKKVEQKIDHYCGNHSKCSNKSFCTDYHISSIEDPKARKEFEVN
jgi:hypothetical protein